MTQIGGVINKRYDNETQKGKKYIKIEIKGTALTSWDENLFPQLNQGDELVVEYESKNGFKNVTKIVGSTTQKEEGMVDAESTKTVQNKPVADFAKNKEASIARMSALKSSVEFYNIQSTLATLSKDKVFKVDKCDIYNLAEQFRNYIEKGEIIK